MLRVTERMGRMTTERELSRLGYDLLLRQRQATDGLRVARPSDDPVAARAVVELDDSRQANAQHQRNVDLAIGDLDVADDALYSATELLQQARELALQLANGAISTEQRADAVSTVQGLRERLVAAGNVTGVQGSIFAGHQTDQPAYDISGAYLGDAGQRQLQVGDGVVERVGLSGDEVFRPSGGEDAFASLAALEAALTADDGAAIAAAGARLDTARQQVVESRAQIGAQIGTVLKQGELLADQDLRYSERRAALVEIDGVEALSELVEAQGALQSALQVSGRILNTLSLVGQL
jgi:flagellar hook-associated protein 3 FlgL